MTDRKLLPRLTLSLPAFGLSAVLFAAGCSLLGSKSDTTTHSTGEPVERAQAPALPTVPKKPSKFHTRLSQYVFYTDFPLETSDPIFRDLEDLPEQLQTELKLPMNSALVQVYLFEDQEKYEAYIKARDPKLPMRRAFFFGERRGGSQPEELIVVTWAGKHLRTDLRHELTHALLHSVLKSVPLWLDEGLAGFFEQPSANDGVNLSHLDAMRRGAFQPNMVRLEKFGQVEQMDRAEYQEAWAWVHFLLRGQPAGKKVLIEYIQALRTNANPGSLHAKLLAAYAEPNTALLDYLAQVQLPSLVSKSKSGK
jgi:hypothetical protein